MHECEAPDKVGKMIVIPKKQISKKQGIKYWNRINH